MTKLRIVKDPPFPRLREMVEHEREYQKRGNFIGPSAYLCRAFIWLVDLVRRCR